VKFASLGHIRRLPADPWLLICSPIFQPWRNAGSPPPKWNSGGFSHTHDIFSEKQEPRAAGVPLSKRAQLDTTPTLSVFDEWGTRFKVAIIGGEHLDMV